MSNSMYDRDEVSTQGLEIQLSDPSHLFRHASEITKGINKYFLYLLSNIQHNAMTNILSFMYS